MAPRLSRLLPQKHKRALSEASFQFNRPYEYTEAGLELSSDSVVKHCPPFLISKHSAATPTLPTALTLTFDYHTRFVSKFAPRFSKTELLQTLTYPATISSPPSAQQEREKPLFQGDSNESRTKLGRGDSPPSKARSAQRYRHRTWHQQPGHGAGSPKTRMPKGAPGAQHSAHYFTMFLGCGIRNSSFRGQLRNTDIPTVLESVTLESSYHLNTDGGGAGVQLSSEQQGHPKGKDKTVLKKLSKICIFYFYGKHD